MIENFKIYLNDTKTWVESQLKQVLEGPIQGPKALRESMAYSLYSGAKRLRPILAVAGCEAIGSDRNRVAPLACALEMIHTYSLIHDDLPAMDDDSLRRGRPTNHTVYGEAVAIVAGDALLTEAFGFLAQAYLPMVREGQVSGEMILQVIAEVARAAGEAGMAGGQVLDLEYEGKTGIQVEQLEQLHRLKTGCLLQASVSLGAKLGGATPAQIQALQDYGAAIGLAFQIQDDILDIEGGEEIGKDIGSDEARGKITYPALLGLDRSKSLAQTWCDRAIACLKDFDAKADPLRQLAHYIVERRV